MMSELGAPLGLGRKARVNDVTPAPDHKQPHSADFESKFLYEILVDTEAGVLAAARDVRIVRKGGAFVALQWRASAVARRI